jgi:threonine synthase
MVSFSKDKEAAIPENILKDMQSLYKTHAVTDSEVLQTIKEFYNKYHYLSDPHTATGLNVLNKLDNNVANISLACAHPAKFKNAIFDAINQEPPIPAGLKNIFDKKEKMTILENEKKLVKSEILKLI